MNPSSTTLTLTEIFEVRRRTATDLLVEAADAIGERAEQRDQPDGERSMARTVAAFNALTGRALTEHDGWVFMVALKLARAHGGRHVNDDYVDAAAYCALAGEIGRENG